MNGRTTKHTRSGSAAGRAARLALALALALAAPLAVGVPPAAAGCPGCDEYGVLDLNDDPVEPEPAPAPTYVPPTATTTPEPVEVVPVAPEPEPPSKPERMVDNRPADRVAPIALAPIEPARAAEPGAGSLVPLVAVIGGATLLALALARRRFAER